MFFINYGILFDVKNTRLYCLTLLLCVKMDQGRKQPHKIVRTKCKKKLTSNLREKMFGKVCAKLVDSSVKTMIETFQFY